MEIKTFYFNPYRECTYVVRQSDKCLIIDPGMYGEKEENRLLDYLKSEQLTLECILVTHAHPDHICGIDCLQRHYPDVPIYGKIYEMPAERMKVVDTWMQVLSTPGHKEDSVCYYFPQEKVMFTGDTLFQESIGRTDLPGGDIGELMSSLRMLSQMDEDIAVYPGHGYTTTIGYEKENNPYL